MQQNDTAQLEIIPELLEKPEKKPLTCIPLHEENGKYTNLIGYFYPERNWVVTPKGSWSVDLKLSSDKRTMIMGNKAHHKRMQAAYMSKDFCYRASEDATAEGYLPT